jgi:hypothetical protein
MHVHPMTKELSPKPSSIKITNVLRRTQRVELAESRNSKPSSAAQLQGGLPNEHLRFLHRPVIIAEALGITIKPCNPEDRTTKQRPNHPSVLKLVRKLRRKEALLPCEHGPCTINRKNALSHVQDRQPILPGQAGAVAVDESVKDRLRGVVWATNTHRINVRSHLSPPLIHRNCFAVHRPDKGNI